MKKGKVIFTAVAVFALVGAGLALSAHTNFSGGDVYTKGSGTGCQVLSTRLLADPNGSDVAGTTVSTTADCPTIKARTVN